MRPQAPSFYWFGFTILSSSWQRALNVPWKTIFIFFIYLFWALTASSFLLRRLALSNNLGKGPLCYCTKTRWYHPLQYQDRTIPHTVAILYSIAIMREKHLRLFGLKLILTVKLVNDYEWSDKVFPQFERYTFSHFKSTNFDTFSKEFSW